MATEQKEWSCPEEGCDKTFTLERGLKRHLHQSHGYPASKVTKDRHRREAAQGKRPAAPAPAPSPAPVAEVPAVSNGSGVLPGLEGVAAPLQQEVKKLETELAALDAQREEVQARLRPLKSALTALSRPSVKPGPKGPTGPRQSKNGKAGPVSEEKIAEVLAFITEHRTEDWLTQGFTGKSFQEHFRAGGGRGHESTLRLALLTLHDRGQIRYLKRTVGGGRVYTPMKQPSDAAFPGGGE